MSTRAWAWCYYICQILPTARRSWCWQSSPAPVRCSPVWHGNLPHQFQKSRTWWIVGSRLDVKESSTEIHMHEKQMQNKHCRVSAHIQFCTTNLYFAPQILCCEISICTHVCTMLILHLFFMHMNFSARFLHIQPWSDYPPCAWLLKLMRWIAMSNRRASCRCLAWSSASWSSGCW